MTLTNEFRCTGLSHAYQRHSALRDVTLDIKGGEIVALIGLNGAGKTTLLRIAAGILEPTTGQACFDGEPVLAVATKKWIGYVPEDPPLDDEANVREYLLTMAALAGVPRRDLESSVNSAVERCELRDVQSRPIGALSRGFRQRVALAQAIAHRPRLLLLDEPTTGLDPNQMRRLLQVLRTLPDKPVVVLSTHLLEHAATTATRILLIHKGRLVADASAELLLAAADRATAKVRGPQEALREFERQFDSGARLHCAQADSTTVSVRGGQSLMDLLESLDGLGLELVSVQLLPDADDCRKGIW